MLQNLKVIESILPLYMLSMMYLRFVDSRYVDEIHSRQGGGQAAAKLVHNPETDAYSLFRTNEFRRWSSEHLERSESFS